MQRMSPFREAQVILIKQYVHSDWYSTAELISCANNNSNASSITLLTYYQSYLIPYENYQQGNITFCKIFMRNSCFICEEALAMYVPVA